MKAFVHTCKDTLIKLSRTCVKLVCIHDYGSEDSDLIYLGSFDYDKEPLIVYSFLPLEQRHMIVLRRQGFVCLDLIDGRDHCQSCGFFSTLENFKDILFSKNYQIQSISSSVGITYTGFDVKSGFGFYCRDLILKIIELYSGKVDLHGCESETVLLMLSGLSKYRCSMFGFPRYEEDEFLSSVDGSKYGFIINERMYGRDGLLKGLKDGEKLNFVVDKYLPMRFEYPHVTSRDSYREFRDKYPIAEKANDIEYSITLGFKYSTFVAMKSGFKYIFEKGVTVKDVGAGFLLKFLLDEGIDAVVEEDEDVSYVADPSWIKRGCNAECVILDPEWRNTYVTEEILLMTRGFKYKFIILPTIFEKDERLIPVMIGRSVTIYQLYVVKKVNNDDEARRLEFRSYLSRKFIRKGDMFDENVGAKDNLSLSMLSASNVRNRSIFKRKVVTGKPLLNKKYMFQFLSAESYMYRNKLWSTKRLIVEEEKGYKDFGIYNNEALRLGSDFISMKDLEVMLYPKRYEPASVVQFDLDSKKVKYWGMLTNVFVDGNQNIMNSPSLLNKSISTLYKLKFGMSETELHKLRFEYLIDNQRKRGKEWSDLNFHLDGDWSLSFYIDPKSKARKFIDVSGHMVNLVLRASISIVNLNGYLRQKRFNITGNGYETSEIEKGYGDIIWKEDRYQKGMSTLWHTRIEDLDGIRAASYIQKDYSINGGTFNIKHLIELVEQLPYKKGELSLTVDHDRKLRSHIFEDS